LNIWFGRSGELLPYLEAVSFVVEPYQYWSTTVLDILFVVMLSGRFFVQWGAAITAFAKHQSRKYWRNPWNWLDFVIVHGGFVVVFMWLSVYGRYVALESLAVDVSKLNTTMPHAAYSGALTPDNPKHLPLFLELHSEVAMLKDAMFTFRIVIVVYGTVIIASLSRVFMAQPRLAVVTISLSLSATEVIHHMIVMVIIWCAFALSGMMIFGRRIFLFTTFPHAFSSVFTMMLGDFDWEELGNDNPFLASVWLWSFMTIMTLLMVNMFMAIIMDVHGRVKSITTSNDSVMEQVLALLHERQTFDGWVSVSVVERIINNVYQRYGGQRIDMQHLLKTIPGMPQEQAEHLIAGARRQKLKEDKGAMSLADMHLMISRIYMLVKRIEARLDTGYQFALEECEDLRAFVNEKADMLTLAQGEEEQVLHRQRKRVPCSKFRKRADAVDSRLWKIERFFEDQVAWAAYRNKQVYEQLERIEVALRRARRPQGAGILENLGRWAHPEATPQAPMPQVAEPATPRLDVGGFGDDAWQTGQYEL